MYHRTGDRGTFRSRLEHVGVPPSGRAPPVCERHSRALGRNQGGVSVQFDIREAAGVDLHPIFEK